MEKVFADYQIMKFKTAIMTAVIGMTAVFSTEAQDLGGDMTLHRLILPDAKWEEVAEGLGFADAPTSDEKGNFYFCDMRSTPPVVWKVAPDGKKTKLIEGIAVSGMKFGPDGRLYTCAGAGKEKHIAAFELPSGKKTVLAENVAPNDLVVTHKGFIYFTETGKKQVTFLNIKTGELKPADVGHVTAPNGIALSPDQRTLAVSDSRGKFVWTYCIQPDGSLTPAVPYMTMRTEVDQNAKSQDGRTPVYQVVSRGDGMSTDLYGRYYVSSAMGVQVFDPTGRECGLLPKPYDKSMTSVHIGGPNGEYMYVTQQDKVLRRKSNVKSFYPWLGPVEAIPLPVK
jgi:sugar lactone lactonase YvrE